jgi:hypothetical protein
MADEAAAPRSRRALLTAAAGAAGALAASAVLPLTAAAHDPDDVQKGVDNPTTATTTITNSGTSIGFQGSSTGTAGVLGWSVEAPDPGWYDPATSTAYTGVSPDIGVFGSGSAGVYGYGGIGVIGESASTSAGVLALAQSATDVALEVQGKVKFSRSGRATIPTGKSNIKVTLAGVNSGCRVFAVLHSNRTGRWVQSVVPVTGSFTIYLNTTVTSATYVAWFVLN